MHRKPVKPELLPDNAALSAVSPADAETALRGGGQQALRRAALPERRPDGIWGGPGAGACCTICGAGVSRDEVELEIEFARDDGPGVDRYHVHVCCFAAWEAELRKAEAARSCRVLPGSGEKRQNAARDHHTPRRGTA